MYQALYRKWRPATFSQVVGQGHITTTLQKQVSDGRVSHAYLFTGCRGTGKTTCARILAKAVNCENPVDGAPCCQCEACRGIESGAFLDITELDAASNSGVDYVRALREEAIYPPAVLRRRVYIIDEVHMLTREAFNALLKVLEEPPAHLLFILATTELHKVPATILSRCQRFTFKRILPEDIAQQLRLVAQAEEIPLTEGGAALLSRMAGGALRDALSLLDQCRSAEGDIDKEQITRVLGLAGAGETVSLMTSLLQRRSADALCLFDRLYREGKDVAALLGELSDLCRDLTIIKAAPKGGSGLLTGLYDAEELLGLAKDESLPRLIHISHTLQDCLSSLGASPRQRTDGELCLLQLCDESLSGDLTALSARVTALERGGVSAVQRTAAPIAEAPAPTRPATAAAAKKSPPPPAPTREVPLETRYDEPPPPPEPWGERVFDIPDEPPPKEPTPSAPPAPRPAPSAPRSAPSAPQSAATQGDTGVWSALLDHYKGRLQVNNRVFLNMAAGVMTEEDCLTVICRDKFVRDALDKQEIRSVLQEVTAAHLGREIRVMLTVGEVPKVAKSAPAAKKSPPPPTPTPAVEKPQSEAETPPWEAPPAAVDKLEALVEKTKTLENFKIK